MKKITIVSSKKYIRSSQFKSLIDTLDIKNIEYEQVDLDKKDDNININPDSIILGLGGDGTALRAMKLGWINKVPVLNIGSGRIGYLVNSLEDVDFEAISSKSNKKDIQSRTPIIQDKNIKSPAFNEIVIIKIHQLDC